MTAFTSHDTIVAKLYDRNKVESASAGNETIVLAAGAQPLVTAPPADPSIDLAARLYRSVR